MTEDKISTINIPIQWLKDVMRRNKEFKVDIADIHSYFGGDFFGKSPEVICQEFKDVLSIEGIDVHLDKYEGIFYRLIFTNFSEPPPDNNIKDKMSKYQKEINECISRFKYVLRINKDFKVDMADLRNHFGGDLFEENPVTIFKIFKYVLLKEGIDLYLRKYEGKNELIFKKFGNLNLQNEVKKLKFINRVPLKPWKDPESLFCDTKFLREFFGKEPRKGEECKTKQRTIRKERNETIKKCR